MSYEYQLQGNILLTGDSNVSFLGNPECDRSFRQAAIELVRTVRECIFCMYEVQHL
jgi:hypothetical protein